MSVRFIHAADIHLGNHQYQLDERFNDFGRAFLGVIDDALRERVDAVIIAGDLFHKRSIDALTLFQARVALDRLRDAGIPTLIIEGNHDKAFYRDASVSWLSFLAWTGSVILLEPQIDGDTIAFAPWDAATKTGGAYDLPGTGVRVYGVPWFGGGTATVIERVAAFLRAAQADEDAAGVRYRVLMLHSGVDGKIPGVHGLPPRAAFEPLAGLVDYVALGHVHMSYVENDWIYNPGSLETVSAEESEWRRGYFLVTATPGQTPAHRAEFRETPKRPFRRERFTVETIPSPEALTERFADFCARKFRDAPQDDRDPEQLPVIDIALVGTLEFDSTALDRRELEAIVRRHCRPLHVIIRNLTHGLDFAPDTGDLDGRDRATWQELERVVLRELLLRDARYAPAAAAWANVLAELKQRALTGEPPDEIAAFLAAAQERLAHEHE